MAVSADDVQEEFSKHGKLGADLVAECKRDHELVMQDLACCRPAGGLQRRGHTLTFAPLMCAGQQLCSEFELSAEDLAAKWEAYSFNSKAALNLEQLQNLRALISGADSTLAPLWSVDSR
jgi:hypothetical protein